MNRQTRSFTSLWLCVLILASGCQPMLPFFFSEDSNLLGPGDLSHYMDVATQIEYPDVRTSTLDEVHGAQAPLTLAGFGTQFATELTDTGIGEWTGPIHSTYGAHLVLVEQRTEARPGNFDDIRDRLSMDFIRARRLESEELRYARMLQRYQVTIEWPDIIKTDSQ